MDTVLDGLSQDCCLVYLDDVIIFSKSFEDHLKNLRDVLQRIRDAGLKLKPKKCHLCTPKVSFLGHIISGEGVTTCPTKVEDILAWPTPASTAELRHFLGLASYYRRFIPHFADIVAPLHKLTHKDSRFCWASQQEDAFHTLKTKLTTSPILAYPSTQEDAAFVLDTDASDMGIGAVLSQIQNGKERVIAYASRTLTKPERRYSTTRRELLALAYFIRYFRHYLIGRRFKVRTDHSALRWIQTFRQPEGQLARWLETLAEFDFEVLHRPGAAHANADAMSRHSLCNRPSDIQEQQCCLVQAQRESVEEVSADLTGNELVSPLGELEEHQRRDPTLADIIDLLQGQKMHTTGATLNPNRDREVLRNQLDSLRIENCLLQYSPTRPNTEQVTWRTVIPRALVPDVLKSIHDDPTAGHLGQAKTLERARQRFYWPNMTEDVHDWCRRCAKCTTRKVPQPTPRAPLVQETIAQHPFQRVAIDIMGPLPTSLKGNKYIAVVADYFSRWTEACALPNQEAETVAKALVREFVCRFGAPQSLHSDQGRNFESAVFKETCSLLGIRKTRTTLYHPQSDGMVERFNRTLKNMLAMYVSENQRDWDDWLPQVMMACRSSVHTSTKYTPHFLLFGKEMRLPVDVMYGDPPGPQATPSPTLYVRNLKETLKKAYNLARQHMQGLLRSTGNG